MTDVSKLLNEKVIEFNSKIKDEPDTAKMIEGKPEPSAFVSQTGMITSVNWNTSNSKISQ